MSLSGGKLAGGNPENGKRWASTMCFAWYVWVKGNKDNPIIEWL